MDDSSGLEDDAAEDYETLIDTLEEIEEMADSPEKQNLARRSLQLARRTPGSQVFGNVIRGFDRKDVGEAFVGSVVFGIPMLVEGGTLEVGTFIASNLFLSLGTLLFTVMLVIGILYFADFQQVEVVNPILGVVPRRLAGILGVSYLTAFVLMTAWGRVDWADPWIAFNQVNVVFTGMALGASLGDILPGT